jgi:drug/metabolite transporter (DMT)-like permease
MNTKLSSVTTGAALVALSALGYATNPIFGKFAYQAGANAVSLLCIRYTFAALGLWGMMLVRREGGGLSLARRLQLLALGGLGMGVVSLLYFLALEHIRASLATGIFYTYPAFVALAGLFRGEGLSRWGLAGLLLTGAGTWLLLSNDLGGFTWAGALLILSGSGLYMLYILVSSKWTRGVPAFVSTTYVVTGCALIYWVMALVTRPPLPGPGAYFAGVGLALCSTIMAMMAFFAGLPRVGPTSASIISTLEPVFTAVLAVVALGDRLTLLQTAGVLTVVAGAIAAQQRERQRERPVAKEA